MWIAYAGTRYQGWQKQKTSENTIQGKLEAILYKLTNEEVEVLASGRTDAGVHAGAQIANFKVKDDKFSIEDYMDAFSSYLPQDIAVYKIEEADPRFYARLSATGKTYVYRIQNSKIPNVFERQYMYQLTEPLDIEAMKEAAKYLVGEHDFKSFCSNKQMKKGTVRKITDISIEKKGQEISISFTGNGFLYNMVRILTGTLIEVGQKKRTPESMTEIIEAKSRYEAGPKVPPMGLILKQVYYEN